MSTTDIPTLEAVPGTAKSRTEAEEKAVAGTAGQPRQYRRRAVDRRRDRDQPASTAMRRPVTPTAGLLGNAALGTTIAVLQPVVVVCNTALQLRTARGRSRA